MKRTLAIVLLCACLLMAVSAQQQEEEEQDTLAEPYKCPDVCAALFDPVCAQLGRRYRTFGNKCELRRYNCKNQTRWRIVREGACPTY
ncbi:U-Kazal-Dg21.2-like [Frankliniella occidentalis]|uniref:U-Kazal-Dg21.2-like n=1 Tax=Frankliniella occidentalis TaxID=133901 RepID=A0A6J1RXW6_FRAOC|nr:U-Kazal-Dg21.2-like [Frankliniella occidentalis]